MNIHPAWYVCLLVRSSLAYFVLRDTSFRTPLIALLAAISVGFLYKSITGSNSETQLADVFWHETRVFHFAFYAVATASLYAGKSNLAAVAIALDIVFSIIYRISTKK